MDAQAYSVALLRETHAYQKTSIVRYRAPTASGSRFGSWNRHLDQEQDKMERFSAPLFGVCSARHAPQCAHGSVSAQHTKYRRQQSAMGFTTRRVGVGG